MKNLGLYIVRFISDWVALVSGIASVTLLVLGISFKRPNLVSEWFWIAAAVCFAFASYRVWLKEHKRLEKLISVDKGPQIVADYEFFVNRWQDIAELESQMSIPLVLRNLTDNPAFDLHIEDVNLGSYTVRFETVSKLLKESPANVRANIERKDTLRVGPFRNAIPWLFMKLGRVEVSDVLRREPEAVDYAPVPSIPVTISYRDIHGTKFISRSELRCSFLPRWSITAAFTGIEELSEESSAPRRFLANVVTKWLRPRTP